LPVVCMGVKLGLSYWGRNRDWGVFTFALLILCIMMK